VNTAFLRSPVHVGVGDDGAAVVVVGEEECTRGAITHLFTRQDRGSEQATADKYIVPSTKDEEERVYPRPIS
jgi:hypothetical protein